MRYINPHYISTGLMQKDTGCGCQQTRVHVWDIVSMVTAVDRT